jgi:hypothetical protein
MSQAHHVARGVHGRFHPAARYNDPGDVLRDAVLSAAAKRAILSSWASDMFAVESNPALRKVPGIARPMRLSDILSALRALDGDDGPPPRGGAVMPFPRPMVSLNAIARRHLNSPQPRLAAARA